MNPTGHHHAARLRYLAAAVIAGAGLVTATAPVTVVQTYLNVPPGGSPRIDEPAPGNCPF